jgi:propanol-preferring alcohol dehydrogenase
MTNQESIPKKQKAVVYEEHGGEVKLEEIPVPEVGDDDILVKVLFSGVCHTDVHVWMGDFPIKTKEFPMVGGHEGTGIVVKVGKNVKEFSVGDNAGIQWINSSCLKCEQCKKGFTQTCANALLSGCTRDGSFQQYAVVKAANAAHVPKDAKLCEIAPILCAGLTVYTALRESGIRPKETVAITGAGGGLGSLCIQYAKVMDLKVLAIDMGEKEKHCKEMGADLFLDPTKTKDIIEEVRKLTDGGPHAVINLATAEKPMDQSCEYVRSRGTVVLVALPKDAQVRVNVFQAVARSITLKGSYVGNRKDTEEAIDYFIKGKVSIPIEMQPLSALPEVLHRLRDGKITGRVVLDLWK